MLCPRYQSVVYGMCYCSVASMLSATAVTFAPEIVTSACRCSERQQIFRSPPVQRQLTSVRDETVIRVLFQSLTHVALQ